MRRIGAVLLALAVSGVAGCGGNNPLVSSASNGSVAQTLSTLQAQGKLPTLDTSATVGGTDSDNNGVRDDLDKIIAALPDSATQKKALVQLAQSIQASMLVDTTNATAVSAVSVNLNRADTCIWSSYTSGQSAKVQMFEEISVNTMTRLTAYEKYNAARHGAAIPSLSGNTCN